MKLPVDPRERQKAEGRRQKGGPSLTAYLFPATIVLLLTGCLGLKPDPDPSRFFVLSPLPAGGADVSPVPADGGLRLGLRAVRIPAYLEPSSLAVRQNDQEILYLEFHQWAERLGKGIQRVLANNLALLLPSNRLQLNAWRRDEVDLELSVWVERFEVDAQGVATLQARWEITSPGADRKTRTGQTRLTREGPAPEADPGGAVATLSELLAQWSRALVQEL
jgi:uncharacterized lipoprotein YmbA